MLLFLRENIKKIINKNRITIVAILLFVFGILSTYLGAEIGYKVATDKYNNIEEYTNYTFQRGYCTCLGDIMKVDKKFESIYLKYCLNIKHKGRHGTI